MCAVYDSEKSLADFALSKTVENIGEQVENIFIYQSKDDTVVPYENALKYKKDLPNAELVIFENRGHFNQKEFPELVERIKNLR